VPASFFGRRRVASEAERPFWISYADLMTAMMMLFLATMAVTIIAVTKKVENKLNREAQHTKDIQDLCKQIKSDVSNNQSIAVECGNYQISFGEAGRFSFNDHHLPEAANQALADLVPVILRAADSENNRGLLKQVVVEGYADPIGTYLSNLNLSMRRSEWVMCLLTDPTKNAAMRLSAPQLQRVRELFLAGGVASNSAKKTDQESRRVELRLQFLDLDEAPLISQAREAATNVPDRCRIQ
jgi:outer membrane protein OmpA-like peptidoglycan-associated protein